MRSFYPRLSTVAVPILLGLGLVGAAVANTETVNNAPAICGINAHANGGMIALEAAFRSEVPVSGSYQLKVRSSGAGGNSSISQGGPFTAMAKTDVTLGQVSVNSAGSYQVEFTVNANGTTLDCSNEIASRR